MRTPRPTHQWPDASPGARWRFVLRLLGLPTLLALLTWQAMAVSYLFGHSLAELFSIVVAVTALVVATTSRDFTRNHFVVFVSVAIGWCAGLDLLHTLAFKGMQLLPTDSANPATQLWISARLLQALALVAAPSLLRRTVRVLWLHLGFGAWSGLCMLLIATGHFPAAYVDAQGLTPFKINTEYVIIVLLGIALLRFWRQRRLMSAHLFTTMMAATLVMMLSEFAFTRYVSVYAPANLVGHLLKIYAYWFVYMALVQNTLREPFDMLARAASTYDAVPDPTLIVAADGTILQANHAAALYRKQAAEALVGQSSHVLLHDPGVDVDHCPVCSQLTPGNPAFMLELDLPAQHAVECSVAPFMTQGNGQAWVQVVRDISERRQLARERETLIGKLGERIKEMSCLYAVSELVKQDELAVPALLDAVVRRLPAAFSRPELLHAAIDSDWGHFGSAWPARAPQHQLRTTIALNGGEVGQLGVWYPDDPAAPPAGFLAEEHALMHNIAQLLSETLGRRQAAERIQRLSYFYELLSATNHAVVRSSSRDELLQALFQALQAHSTFPVVFIALTEDGRMPLQLLLQHGVTPERLPQLARFLGSPASPLARTLDELGQGDVIVTTLPLNGNAAAQARADEFAEWAHYLAQRNIHQRAVLPLRCEGMLQGVVGLYASGLSEFDAEQLRLLNEVSSDMAFALGTLANQTRRQAAEQQAARMEKRFEEIFKVSPVPMQIHALAEHRISAINQAHQRWLGYSLTDLAAEDDWFARAYPDPALQQQLRGHWQSSIASASQGELTVSPELILTCKDGSQRIALGTMTVVGNDAIVAWTDLTDIRQSEQTLRDSEQRFRSMVEQTISGMYVHRDGKFIYVNPRFCEIIGWPAAELLGQDVLQFTSSDPETVQRIRQAWDELHSSHADHVTYSVPIRRKDGQYIELGLNSKVIIWDDGLPATIVMAQDVTERKQAEERINAYVKQLEASMRGTLQAVANMVEMRDPYTAGHERRVGLIARDLAREMGWSPERCDNLELLGLVHDIGKIAVPSEILTKPARLSSLEMALMHEHAQAGYDILKDVPFPTPVAEIILQHHERMDGSGYPKGLKGDAILPEARVLAVADVIESISSHRPYRPALGIDAGLQELQDNRGRLYDPEVVDAMVRLVTQQGYTLPD